MIAVYEIMHAVVAIADALVKINSLVYLNLGNNCITQQAATKIGDVIYSNHAIKELHSLHGDLFLADISTGWFLCH